MTACLLPLPGKSRILLKKWGSGRVKKAQTLKNSACAFQEPDTRRQPLPLLPFGPGGVGGDAAARLLYPGA